MTIVRLKVSSTDYCLPTTVYFPSIHLALLDDLPVDAAGVFVGALGVGALVFGNLRRLLAPTLIDGLEAPLGAAARGADGPAPDDDEDGVRVRGGQDAERDPRAALDRDFEGHVAQRAVGQDVPRRDAAAVDDDFERHLARVADARALDVPVRRLVLAAAAHRLVRLFVQKCRHAR